jgi:hypothetical protein
MSSMSDRFYKKWWPWVFGPLVFISVIVVLSITNSKTSSDQRPAASTNLPMLMGFGATRDDWNRNHIADSRFTSNSDYNPDPALPDQRYNDRYVVTSGAGRILSYEMRLSGRPNIEVAEAEALKEFPSDASMVWFSQKGDCSQMEVQSKTLGAILSDPGNPRGAVLGEFQTAAVDGKDIYNATNNNDVFFNLGLYQSAQNAPGC